MRNTTVRYANNRIKEFRQKAGLTQLQVAMLISLQCDDRICRWEQGTATPNIENLFKLAKIFHVLPHHLYPELFK